VEVERYLLRPLSLEGCQNPGFEIRLESKYPERSQFMAYTYTNSRGTTYILHARTTTLESGKTRTLYFFAKEAREGTLEAVPEGYEVSESKNGLPVLKRKN
jgi:hypothetical protein